MKKKSFPLIAALTTLLVLPAESFGEGLITRHFLEVAHVHVNKLDKKKYYADECEHIIDIPYVENGHERQVIDVYYAKENRKDAVLIEIHGGFYTTTPRQNHRKFVSEFLKEGFDVVLLEYRLVDGVHFDISDQLADCAAAVDYIYLHADSLHLNKDRMFLTGNSSGAHLALYTAEGSVDKTMPIHCEFFRTQGVLLNCPAYDYAAFNDTWFFTKDALEWFIGPRYRDRDWLMEMSPRTHFRNYHGPLFVSTSRKDFLRMQAMVLVGDCYILDRTVDFVHIESKHSQTGHVHNVNHPEVEESKEVNAKMVEFMNRVLEAQNSELKL